MGITELPKIGGFHSICQAFENGLFTSYDVRPQAALGQQPGLSPTIADNMAPPSSTQGEDGPQIFMDIRIGDRQGEVVENTAGYCSQNPPST